MTTIFAKPIADSIGEISPRLLTIHARYPRTIHSELMAHRVFSRNARSSRAVPAKRLIEEAIYDYAEPLHWGKNQAGMQAREELTGVALQKAKDAWHRAREAAIREAILLVEIGAHKQVINRILEPYTHIDVLITSTQWANFLTLRDHADAEPHIAILAREIGKVLECSTSKVLRSGEWHLPYIGHEWEWFSAIGETPDGPQTEEECWALLRKVSTARCARISYTPFDSDKTDVARDIELHDELVVAEPLHASPAEHQATPDEFSHYQDGLGYFRNEHLAGNLGPGWIQYRKTLPREFIAG